MNSILSFLKNNIETARIMFFIALIAVTYFVTPTTRGDNFKDMQDIAKEMKESNLNSTMKP